MTRITVDVNDEWLAAAQDVLGTETKVATVNAALQAFAVRKQAAEIVAAFDAATLDFAGSGEAWGYRGGRELTGLVDEARDTGVA